MTAPAPLSGGDARTQLAAEPHRMVAGSRKGVVCSCGWTGPGAEHETHALDKLAELVERIADERAAEALEQAAQWLTGTGHGKAAPDVASDGLSWRDCRTPNEASDWFEQSLRDRAASLRAASRGETAR